MPKISILIALLAVSAHAQQPAQTQGPHRYAPGEYRLVKDGNTVSLFLRNSITPIPLTMAAPNMFVSNAGVIYNEVPGSGLIETSLGVNMGAFSPEAVAATEKERTEKVRRREEALDNPVGAVPDAPALRTLGTSVSADYPVTTLGLDGAGRMRARINYQGRQLSMVGLKDRDGVPWTDPKGNPQFWMQQGTDSLGKPIHDTAIYEVAQQGNGWAITKTNLLPVLLEPIPTKYQTIQRDGLGNSHLDPPPASAPRRIPQ